MDQQSPRQRRVVADFRAWRLGRIRHTHCSISLPKEQLRSRSVLRSRSPWNFSNSWILVRMWLYVNLVDRLSILTSRAPGQICVVQREHRIDFRGGCCNEAGGAPQLRVDGVPHRDRVESPSVKPGDLFRLFQAIWKDRKPSLTGGASIFLHVLGLFLPLNLNRIAVFIVAVARFLWATYRSEEGGEVGEPRGNRRACNTDRALSRGKRVRKSICRRSPTSHRKRDTITAQRASGR
jgi:hypothetical protein